jgi:hypothetical protein
VRINAEDGITPSRGERGSFVHNPGDTVHQPELEGEKSVYHIKVFSNTE